jgi:Ca2+-transporting ATPase
MSLVSLGVGWWSYTSGDPAWQSLLFTTLIFSQIVLAIEVRSETNSILKTGLFTNRSMVIAVVSTVLLQFVVLYVPFFQSIFKTQALGARDIGIALGASFAVLLFVEVWKWLMRRRARG